MGARGARRDRAAPGVHLRDGAARVGAGRVLWPAKFAAVVGVIALTTFGLMGHAYEARESYYTGFWGGALDDPFTTEDDWDRAHLSLGIVSAM